MRHCLSLIMLLLSFSGLVASDLEGYWMGDLKVNPQVSLRFGINISSSKEASIDSPDQGAYDIPVEIIHLSNDSLVIAQPQMMLNYRGKLQGDSLAGIFSQGQVNIPLVLYPGKKTANRPQTPKAPFTYISEDVEFTSMKDGAKLAGTLTLPYRIKSSTPIAVLVSGSGVQNRDEELFEHKPFAVIADYLACKGIGALRYDDRGFDSATGLKPNDSSEDNALDTEGAISFLREKGFTKIGLIGHSEGGLIADMIASRDENVKFVVEIGGPAVTGDKILLFQNEFILKDGGVPDETVEMYLEAIGGIMRGAKDKAETEFNEADYRIFSSEFKDNPMIEDLVKNLREGFGRMSPWLKYFISYDPLPDLKKIKAPTLLIYGENDMQVPPAVNIPALKDMPENIEVKVYPGLNHLMQHSETGRVAEYGVIEETISPEVLQDISEFIVRSVKK